MNIKETFNWLVEKPQSNFTLGEAFRRHVLKKPEGQIVHNRLRFTRAGRMAERFVTLFHGVAPAAILVGAGLLGAAAISVPLAIGSGALAAVATSTGLVGGFAILGAFNIAAAKGAGILVGKTVDLVAYGLNKVAQSPKQSAPKA